VAVVYKATDMDLKTIDDEEGSYSTELLRELRVLERRAQAGPASSNPDCPTTLKTMPLTWVTDWNWYQSYAVGHIRATLSGAGGGIKCVRGGGRGFGGRLDF
jgi:hypothetical protein